MNLSIIKKHRNDIILISALLIISLVAWLILTLSKTQGAYAVVVVNGEETESYPLSVDVRVTIESDDAYNVLVIENNTAKIVDASCPDKLCVDQHEVSYNGETIVCLPNKTTVKIVSDVDSDVDLVS